MYKRDYEIQPSTYDFFENKLKGTGNWTLHKIRKAWDSVQFDPYEYFHSYNFYNYVGKAVRTETDVLKSEAELICPPIFEIVDYQRKTFDEKEPTPELIEAQLEEESKREIKISLFGNLEKKRQMFIIEHRGERLDKAQKEWIRRKEEFESQEDTLAQEWQKQQIELKLAADQKQKEYDEAHEANMRFLYGTQEDVEASLQFLDTYFPQDINLFYQVDLARKLVNISFEAPSDRIIPTEKEVTHSRGKSIKPKIRSEINKDYVDCVVSLAYVLAAGCFNRSAKIESVYISSFVNKFDRETATMEEQTLYAIVFDRDTFNWVIKPKSFLPYESLVFFPHTIEIGHLFTMLPVNPLELSPAGEILAGDNQFVDSTKKDGRFSSYKFNDDIEDKLGGYVDLTDLDERFEEAAKWVVIAQRCSTSDLQRKLGMGYAKAGRVVNQLEAAGIVGPMDGVKPREVLISDIEALNEIIKAFRR